MINQIRAEWYKLRRNKTFWVLVLTATGLSALLNFLVITDWWMMSNTVFESAGIGELNALSAFTLPLMFNLFLGTFAGFYIATEYSQSGAIKNQILSGSARRHIFLAKYLILTLGSIILTILIPLLTAIIEIVALGYGERLTAETLLYIGRAFGLFALQLLGYTAILLVLAVIAEDSGRTIIFSIVFSILVFVVDKLPKSPLFETLYEYTIFYQFHDVFRHAMTNGEMLRSIAIAAAALLLLLGYGAAKFAKKEIK